MMNRFPRRYWVLALLALGTGAGAFIGKDCWFVDAFAANLSAGFLGGLATVILIDRAAEIRQTAERKRIEAVALANVCRPLRSLTDLTASLIKASQEEQSTPGSLPTLFSTEQLANIDWLDLGASAGVIGGATWYAHLATTVERARHKISVTLDRYLAFLDVSLVEALESLSDDTFLVLMGGLEKTRMDLLRDGINLTLTLNGTSELRIRFSTKLLKAVAAYEQRSGDKLLVPPEYSRADIAPKVGASRLKQLLPPMGVSAGPPPPL